VRIGAWLEHEWAEVTAVGRSWLLAVDQDGCEDSWRVDRSDWIKVEPKVPIPHRYIGLISERECGPLCWRSATDVALQPETREILHIWTDEDGVDRIERVTP
jgi:hypothetical protein